MLKNIVFDFGNVLCRFDRMTIFSAFFSDPDDLKAAIPVLFRQWTELDEGFIDYDQYVEESLTMMPERLRDASRRLFYEWHLHLPPIVEMWGLAAELKARGFDIFVLSNAPTYFAEHLDVYPILKLFDDTVVSAPIQMAKPHADIFDYAMTKFDTDPSETLFIDDNADNIEGAKAFGLHAFHFTGDVAALRAAIDELAAR